VLCREVHA
jgi:hypothetical protein